MPRIVEATLIDIRPQALWKKIGGFGSVAEWHPYLESVDLVRGDKKVRRIVHGKAGSDQTERLDALDGERHLYRYTLEQSSMPVRDYTGELRVDAAGDGASKVVWSAKFELDDDGDGRTVESVRHFLRAGTESLEQKYGKAPEALAD